MFELFHSRNAQATATWIAILTAFFTGIGKLIPEWFGQYSWPQLILMAFGGALATLLALSLTAFFTGAGGALYRRFHPLPSVPGSAFEQPELPLASDGRTLTERLNKIETTHRAIVDDYQRMLGLEARFADMLDKLKVQIGADNETALNDKLRELAATQELDRQHARTQVASLYRSLTAIFHREQLQILAANVEGRAAVLDAPTTHAARYDADQWEAWTTTFFTWRGIVQQWVDIAERYLPHTDIHVFDVHPDQLQQKGVAKVDQFPDPEAFISYKGFWIVLKQWRERREEVEQAVHQVAFEGRVSDPQPPVLGRGLFS